MSSAGGGESEALLRSREALQSQGYSRPSSCGGRAFSPCGTEGTRTKRSFGGHSTGGTVRLAAMSSTGGEKSDARLHSRETLEFQACTRSSSFGGRESSPCGAESTRMKPSFLGFQSAEDEMTTLRMALVQQQLQRQQAVDNLARCAYEEQRELESLRKLRSGNRLKVRHAIILQSWWRAILTRRQYVETLMKAAAERAFKSSFGLLSQQISELRTAVYGKLLHKEEDRIRVVVKLQSWWRCIIARRALLLIRVARSMQIVHQQMQGAARVIQRYFRGYRTRKEMQALIQTMSADEIQDWLRVVKNIVNVQRAYRAVLARRHLSAAKTAMDRRFSAAAKLVSIEQPHLNTLSVRNLRALVSHQKTEATSECAHQAEEISEVRSEPEESDRSPSTIEAVSAPNFAMERVMEAGLEPFFESAARERLRHRIGGLEAACREHELQRSRRQQATTSEEENAIKKFPGSPWDVHFTDEQEMAAAKKLRLIARRARSGAGRRSTGGRSHVRQTPPRHSELRASARAKAAAVPPAAAEAVEYHPMLVNAPLFV